MTTTETTQETPEDHIREARRFAAQAEERDSVFDRSADLQAAQVHATLAQTLKAGELLPLMAGLAEWAKAGCPEPAAASEAAAEVSDAG